MPAWLAPAIMAAGGIASSLLSRKGGNDMPPYGHQMQAQFDYEKESTRRRPSWLAEGARRAGYHPLAVLGMNPASGPTIVTGGQGRGRDYGRVAEYAARGLSAYVNRAALETRQAQEDERLRGMKIENDVREKELESMGQSPLGPRPDQQHFGIVGSREQEIIQGQPGVQFRDVEIPYSKRGGIEAGTGPLETEKVDQLGFVWRVPSKEVQETLESSWFHQIRYMISRGWNWASGIGAYVLKNSPGARNFRNQLRATRPKAPAGYEYRFNVMRGQWRLNKGVTGLLFDHKSLTYTHGPYYKGKIKK